jgi:hypothetical protein
MIAVELDVRGVAEVLRLVRALGSHRYVAGRLHLVHALGLASIPDDTGGVLAEARAWAVATAGQADIDPASRDERLWRRCSDAELVAVLEAYWAPGSRATGARGALQAWLERHDLMPEIHPVFDEALEGKIHPLVVDAGWELMGLSQLDAERHKGAIAAFGNPLAYQAARLEEETTVPSVPHLYELPAIGPVELLRGADDKGQLAEPFVVWTQGDETYLDYVLRGVRRSAKVE